MRDQRKEAEQVIVYRVLDKVFSINTQEKIDTADRLKDKHFTQSNLSKVFEFMEVAGQRTTELRDFDNVDLSLRVKLIFEELMELYECIDMSRRGDLETWMEARLRKAAYTSLENQSQSRLSAIDAIADLEYVVLGSYDTVRLTHDQALEMFEEVHRSNMTKFPDITSIDEVKIGVQIHQAIADNPGVTEVKIDMKRGKLILLNAAGKVIKPTTYKKVNLAEHL